MQKFLMPIAYIKPLTHQPSGSKNWSLPKPMDERFWPNRWLASLSADDDVYFATSIRLLQLGFVGVIEALTISSVPVQYVGNLMTVACDDILDPCSGNMAHLMALTVWAVERELPFVIVITFSVTLVTVAEKCLISVTGCMFDQ